MNKIMPIFSVVILAGCSMQPIKTPEPTTQHSQSTRLDQSAPAQDNEISQNDRTLVPVKRHRIADRTFRQHTVIPVNKKTTTQDSSKSDSLIPRLTRYIKQGIASWYGPKFHGRKTATGEIFNMYALTAAHKTLPIPCYAQVTNLENNRSIIVRVNDRGPYVGNRLLDLSYAAAKELDIHKNGLGKVEIVALTDAQAEPRVRLQGKSFDKTGR